MQDDFQASPNLTLNLGLRYEFITSPTEVNGRLANLNHPLDPTTTIGNPYFENPSLKNFSPRIGFAWDPTGSGKFSVRGGFGLFHQQILQWAYISSVFRTTPFAVRPSLVAGVHDPANCGSDLTNGVDCNGVYVNDFPHGLQGLDQDHPAVLFPNMNPVQKPNQPYLMQWSLTLQQEITSSTVVTATYAGSRGVKLSRPGDTNIPTPTLLGPLGSFAGGYVVPCASLSDDSRAKCVAPRANPSFQQLKDKTWDANSWYHALKLGLRKRFDSGFSYQLSYQWQKIIDQGSSVSGNRNEFGNDVDATSNWFDHRFDQGRSAWSIGRVLSANASFELPFGPGRRYGASTSGFAAKLIEGWSINAIVSLSDGAPTSFEGAGGITCSFCSTGRMRPQLMEGEEIRPTTGDPNQWWGPNDIFAIPNLINLADGTPCDTSRSAKASYVPGTCAGTWTNLGRTAVTGPGAATLDFSVHKNFFVGETVDIQFRAEFFNIMNRSNFGTPGIGALTGGGSAAGAAGSFGLVTATATTSRQIQLALKVLF